MIKKKEVKYPRYYRAGKSYKLTVAEIKEIKAMRKNKMPVAKIAKKFKISMPTVRYHTNPKIKARVNEYAKAYKKMTPVDILRKQNRSYYYDKMNRMGKSMKEYFKAQAAKYIKRFSK